MATLSACHIAIYRSAPRVDLVYIHALLGPYREVLTLPLKSRLASPNAL